MPGAGVVSRNVANVAPDGDEHGTVLGSYARLRYVSCSSGSPEYYRWDVGDLQTRPIQCAPILPLYGFVRPESNGGRFTSDSGPISAEYHCGRYCSAI